MAKGTVIASAVFGMCALVTTALAAADAKTYTIIELDPGETITKVVSNSRLDRVIVAEKEGIVGVWVYDKRCSKVTVVSDKATHKYTACKDGGLTKEG